ncbi:triacylglycerol lipase [Teladorsagia circumcincta]|uniref:Triacylglycerol lipase n=1 Tax=Teladorsagia circumcincta TaxID=45464 RepID=A0A2G9UXL9_TELCI|nr:triacylglycerol lipase [Teladorsagia circumcincta]
MRRVLLLCLLAPFILAAPFSNDATYSDAVARTKMLPLAAAAYGKSPQACLTNRFTDAVVTGHSLGGAMASLAASYIVAAKLVPANNVELVTYGQPRTGNKDFAAAHDSQMAYSYRVTHWRDIVPHVPPEHLEGYRHHKSEAFYHNDMKAGASFKVCDADEDKNCSDGLDITVSIPDHLHYFNIDVSEYGEKGCK